MKTPVILAIDQGTTNSKAFLFASTGEVLARASRSMSVSYPKPGWAELDAMRIWETVRETIAEVLATRPDVEVQAIGIANQRESIVLWDGATGRPVGPCILWQCRRSAGACNMLREGSHEQMIAELSGLGLDPLFPAAKLAWLLDSTPELRDHLSNIKAGTVDSWLLWNLTGGAIHATDASNASRTQLMNIDSQTWDPKLAELFRVPIEILPEIRPSNAIFGSSAEKVTDLPGGVPIRAIMGDSHSALFGHNIRAPGQIKVTLGTGSSLMAITPERPRSTHGLSSTIAWKSGAEVTFALEGNISVSGQTAAFAVELLNLQDERELTELAQSTADANGVVFVPALAGLGAPHWKDAARGQISGMTLGTRPAHVARAAFDAIALQILDVIEAMELDLGAKLPDIVVDGGAAANDYLMQLLSSVLNRPVRRPSNADVTALGVAQMAGRSIGLWAHAPTEKDSDLFLPAIEHYQREDLISKWHHALEKL